MADLIVMDPLLGEKNIVFGWPNRIDEATLSSSGTWQATLPLANLQSRVLATVARSNMSLLADPDIVIDLGQARRIGVVALVAHNLSVVATLRVEGATDAGFTAGVYDSGFFNVWPSGVVDADLLEWEDDNFWLGTVSAEARAGYQAPCIHLLPAAEIARYWRITLHDPGNADGYLQAGRVFLSDVWQPAANYSYGAQLGYEDRSGVAESLGGTEFFDARAKFRVHRLTLDWLSESEGYNRLIEMQRQLGQTGELLVIPDPSDAANMPRRAMLGRIAKLTPLEHAMTDRTRSTLEIKEIL